MQTLYLLITGVALYFLSDRILDWMERRAGHRFEQRSMIFFALMLGMSLIAFALIRHLSDGG